MKRNLGIYIHIPFCIRKCYYCDFLSAPAADIVIEEYVDALCEEMRQSSGLIQDYIVDTVFIGGGTPSILKTELILKIGGALNSICFGQKDSDNFTEFTAECNPGTVDKSKLMAFRRIGVNRISLGVQSLNDDELRILGRLHDKKAFLESYSTVRNCGFTNVNLDLMSALPNQTLESWIETLEEAAKLEPEHISGYSLILEPGTPFYEKYQAGVPPLPDEDTEREMYMRTSELLGSKGYYRYEISNYARQGYECKHNIGYWTGKDYLGLGLGASSLIRNIRYKNTDKMDKYMSCLSRMRQGRTEQSEEPECGAIFGAGTLREETCRLAGQEQMEEFMFLGLRLSCGVSYEDFRTRFGQELDSVYGKTVQRLEKLGLLIGDGVRLRLTDRGVDVSNRVFCEFLQ